MLHARLFTDNSLEYLHETAPALENRVLQLGGSEPEVMLQAARRAGELGWKEINLNVGCPSKTVQCGSFGAVLMKEPHTVSRLCNAIAEGLGPGGKVTVKCRVGIDHLDTYEFFRDFIKIVSESSPVNHFIVHARKAHLKGLSPAQNRLVPPLNYSRVSKLKEEMPDLKITLNGGISSLEEIRDHASVVEGVMLGRQIRNDAFFLTEVETELFGTDLSTLRSREQVLKEYIDYAEKQQSITQSSLSLLLRAVYPLYPGNRGRKWRNILDQRFRRARLENNLDVRSILEDAWTTAELSRAETERRCAENDLVRETSCEDRIE